MRGPSNVTLEVGPACVEAGAVENTVLRVLNHLGVVVSHGEVSFVRGHRLVVVTQTREQQPHVRVLRVEMGDQALDLGQVKLCLLEVEARADHDQQMLRLVGLAHLYNVVFEVIHIVFLLRLLGVQHLQGQRLHVIVVENVRENVPLLA